MYETIVILSLLWIICNREWFGPAADAVKQSLSDDFKRDPIGVIGTTVMMLVTFGVIVAFLVYGFWMISRGT